MGWSYSLTEISEALDVVGTKEDIRITGVSTDTRTIKEGDLFVALSGENFDGNAFVDAAFDKGAVAAIGTAPNGNGVTLIVEDTLKALQNLAAWHRNHFEIPVLAITGSCGKTTSKDWTTELLRTSFNVLKTEGNLNNEIGCPQTLLRLDNEIDFAVIEMGANHKGEIRRLCELARPTESVITMVGSSHLEGFGSMDDIAEAKGEIVGGLPSSGVFYLNSQDERCRALAHGFSGKIVSFGREKEDDVRLVSHDILEFGKMKLVIEPIGEIVLPIYSVPHIQNALLAIAVSVRHGVTSFEAPLTNAIRNSSRLKITHVNDLCLIDDTYNANPESMSVAVECLGQSGRSDTWALLGEMLELGETSEELHRTLGAQIGATGINHVLARGTFAQSLVDSAQEAGVEDARVVSEHDDMADVVFNEAQPDAAVLFKGSRGMTMEKAIDRLLFNLQNTPSTHGGISG
jgi:UDP-N-acetylmuramoyl-tripeptide--D-alanyl-D-alanine ligase